MDLNKELQVFAESRLKRSLTVEEKKLIDELIKQIESEEKKPTSTDN
ncbi:hypothetical protein [Entomomonas asaccharolytica]|uniref:Uncharacterized protein n=1 Tax=Entomomonas asaccharolytica TaxID=2785331 RepID=A0A974NCZ3_9GAMM|nr:hypothetical protein [Entomomonas asaccharolytica]QQP84435.1 hypothetical protein JHT90_08360 [Entomomonas asaccharolytica]